MSNWTSTKNGLSELCLAISSVIDEQNRASINGKSHMGIIGTTTLQGAQSGM